MKQELAKEYQEELDRRQRSSSKAGRGLMVTNIVDKWRRVADCPEVSA